MNLTAFLSYFDLAQIDKLFYLEKYASQRGLIHKFNEILGYVWPFLAKLIGFDAVNGKAANFFCKALRRKLLLNLAILLIRLLPPLVYKKIFQPGHAYCSLVAYFSQCFDPPGQ